VGTHATTKAVTAEQQRQIGQGPDIVGRCDNARNSDIFTINAPLALLHEREIKTQGRKTCLSKRLGETLHSCMLIAGTSTVGKYQLGDSALGHQGNGIKGSDR
jgi:hypothetical protein